MLASSSSGAALVPKDFSVLGDGQLTLDTSTQLEWLDLSYTDGVSFEAVQSGWADLTTSKGFRYATGIEIDRLFRNAGLTISSDFLVTNYAPAIALHSLLGSTASGSNYQLTSGYYALGPMHQTSTGWHYSLLSYWLVSTSRGDATVGPITLACIMVDCYSVGSPDYGSFLVRQNTPPIPEPATTALLGLGIAFLLPFLRRRGEY